MSFREEKAIIPVNKYITRMMYWRFKFMEHLPIPWSNLGITFCHAFFLLVVED